MTTASPEIKRVSDTPCAIGENPLWHPDERALYWTDIPNGKLYRLDPDLGITEPCYEGTPVGGFTVQESGALLLFMAGGSVAEWREGTRTYLIEGLDAESDSRFYCGTMPTGERLGRLYRLDRDGSIHVVLERVGSPMAWVLPRSATGSITPTRARSASSAIATTARRAESTTLPCSSIHPMRKACRTGSRWMPRGASGRHAGAAGALPATTQMAAWRRESISACPKYHPSPSAGTTTKT